MNQRALLWAGLLALLPAVSAMAPRQSLQDMAAELQEGEIRLSFDAREGVCGCGDSIFIEHDDGSRSWRGCHGHDCECEEGPVHVRLKVRDGDIASIKTRVGRPAGGDDDRIIDLGLLSPQEAAERLLVLSRGLPDEIAADAVWPVQLGREVVVWPQLLAMARDRSLGNELRQATLFWLSQIAGDKITSGLRNIVDDSDEELEVRETAMFALYERDKEESLPALAEIARASRHPQLRRSALFWLAQLDDPRALAIFEDILVDD